MRKTWGIVVGGLFTNSGLIGGLYAELVGYSRVLVDSLAKFYKLMSGLIRELSHIVCADFPSVKGGVLPAFHTTYNNERRFYLNNLVINT